jgi:hypothetical protein
MNKIFSIMFGMLLLSSLIFALPNDKNDKGKMFGYQTCLQDGNFVGETCIDTNGYKYLEQKMEMTQEQFQSKITQFKEKIQERLQKYEDKKFMWQENRKAHKDLNSMLDSNMGKKLTVEYVQVVADKMVKHLENLKNAKNADENFINEQISKVYEFSALIDVNSTTEEILTTIENIQNVWKNSEHKRKAFVSGMYLDGTKNVLEKMENTLNDLNKKISDLNNSELLTELNNISEKLADLKVFIAEKQVELKSIEEVDVNEINVILQDVRVKIHEVRTDLVKLLVPYNAEKGE